MFVAEKVLLLLMISLIGEVNLNIIGKIDRNVTQQNKI